MGAKFVSGSLPHSVTNFEQLQQFYLGCNSLSGRIPNLPTASFEDAGQFNQYCNFNSFEEYCIPLYGGRANSWDCAILPQGFTKKKNDDDDNYDDDQPFMPGTKCLVWCG